MFKKLKSKFLLINMLMITVLLFSAFGAVYIITYNNTYSSIEQLLDRTLFEIFNAPFEFGGNRRPENGGAGAFRPREDAPTTGEEQNAADTEAGASESGYGNFNNEPPRLNEGITIFIDTDKNILNVRSSYDYGDDFYNSIVTAAAERYEDAGEGNEIGKTGKLNAGDAVWMYKIIPQRDSGYRISAVDISLQTAMLTRLAVSFIIVALLALVLIFLISRYFAGRVVRPIEESWNKQTQFIADASHELRTPLTTINTNIDVLLSHPDSLIQDEKKWLIYIKNEAERMSKLTNDLLYLARADNDMDGRQTTPIVFSYSETVENVLLTMEAVMFENNIAYSDQIAQGINIKGDPSKIKQLVVILLDNTVKYVDSRRIVRVELSRNEKHAFLKVKNSSEGIKDEDIGRLFDRFYRTDKSRARRSGGHGLGLAIAKSIVEEHKGDIKVYSKSGEYVEFTVKLPVYK